MTMGDACSERYGWIKVAAATAEATGKFFHIGVRPKGDWFANCDGIEWDGSTPEQAVQSVVESLKRRATDTAHSATAEQRKAEALSAALAHNHLHRDGEA